MKIAYVTMRFPVPSETFACTDIRTLRTMGASVSVHTLCPPRVDPVRVLGERGLSDLHVTHGTVLAHLMGVLACLRRPLLTLRVAVWLAQTSCGKPRQFVLGLAAVPRSVGVVSSLQRERPDVVHLFWGHYPSIVGFLVLRSLPETVLSVFLGAYDLTTNFGGSAWVARRADVVSTHARWNVRGIEEFGVSPQRIHLAYRGIDRGLFGGNAARAARRIVSAGRLEESKGMGDVLRVFREVRHQWPDATLRILGDGPDRAKFEELSRELGIGGDVVFLGHVAHSELARELASAHVLLHMSWDETERLPNVVKEAMASGCACVVTETSGIEELLQDRLHGFVVSPRDVTAAARRVDDIFSGRVDVALMLSEAERHIAQFFDVTRSMQSYVDRWREAVTRRRIQQDIALRSPQRASV